MVEVKVKWEGSDVMIVLGELSWGAKNDSLRQSIYITEEGKKEIDTILQRELLLVASIKVAPFPVTLDNIRKLSLKDGERLYSEFEKMISVSDEVEG